MMNIDALVVKYAGWIREAAGKFCSDVLDSEDLASETIYKILSNRESYNQSRSFKPWALAIMANTFKTRYKRSKCVLFTSYREYEHCCSNVPTDCSASLSIIYSIIRKCSLKSRTVKCVLMYVCGFRYDEIADIIGIPVGTVKSRVAAGRKMLREALE